MHHFVQCHDASGVPEPVNLGRSSVRSRRAETGCGRSLEKGGTDCDSIDGVDAAAAAGAGEGLRRVLADVAASAVRRVVFLRLVKTGAEIVLCYCFVVDVHQARKVVAVRHC